MARSVLLRFKQDEKILDLIDEVAKKLGVTGSALAKMAVYDYCLDKLEKEKNGKSS